MVPFATYTNLKMPEIRRIIKNSEFGRYVLLYLYDGFDWEARREADSMFGVYGREINNALRSDFTLLTVYDKSIINDGFMGRDEIQKFEKKFCFEEVTPESSEDRRNNYGIMMNLAEAYKVRLPALIVIDTQSWKSGCEVLFKIELGGAKPKEIAEKIISVGNIIAKYYNDFNAISAACHAAIQVSRTTLPVKQSGNLSLYNLLNDYIDMRHTSIVQTAKAVGISEKTLRRYMAENENGKSYPFPRETAIAVALVLKLTSEETDKLFDATRVSPLRRLKNDDPRESLIRECLDKEIGLEATNNVLKNNRFEPICVRTRKTKKPGI